MDNFSAYELAQQRIEQRRRKASQIVIWILMVVLFILFSIASGGLCGVPLAIIGAIFAILSGVDWYYTSERGRPGTQQVTQEMAWLFGESWEDSAGVHEYALALERIRRRRMSRMRFFFHLALFVVSNGAILVIMFYNQNTFHEPPPVMVQILMLIWLGGLAFHGIRVFPTRTRLEMREREAAEAIRREMEKMQPAKRKNKLKRDAYYRLGEDGELVEVDAVDDEKPKNQSFTNDQENS